MDHLLERARPLDVLRAAVTDAAEGRGGVVVVTGEAGIGRTSLVRAFCSRLGGRARVLAGACDDLLTPRPLGPLRDAAAGTGGPLEAALRTGSGGEHEAVVSELGQPAPAVPTVLVVEDLHWCDGATLDALGYLARRIARLRAVLVVTVRDDGAPRGHPLHRWFGGLAGLPVRRVALPALSASAVAELAAGTGWRPSSLMELTAGNPFFVSEMLSSEPADGVPASVVDAVTARAEGLDERCRGSLAQLSVVPGVVAFELVEELLGDDLAALADAEDRGIVEVRADGVAFRHELVRRAVESGMSALRRRVLHLRVVTAMERIREPDVARLAHHASEARDIGSVIRYATRAGREAAAAGSHRQALAHFEAAARHLDRLDTARRAALLDDYAWELHIARRFDDAVAAGEEAVRLHAELGDPVALGETQVRLSRYLGMAGDTGQASRVASAAFEVLAGAGSPVAAAYAAVHHGEILALTGDDAAGTAVDRAHALAVRAGRADLAGLCLSLRGIAGPGLGDDERVALVEESLCRALRDGPAEHAARGYTGLATLLFRFGRLSALERCVRDGLELTTGRGLRAHAHDLERYRCLLLLRRGDWDAAADGLAALPGADDDPAQGRLLARRDDPAAEGIVTAAWERACRQGCVDGLAEAGTALLEWAWLSGRQDTAVDVLDAWREHGRRPGAEPLWAEVQRYAARAGLSVPVPAAGSPEPWACGLRGDWRTAADRWLAQGDPYEAALELAESGLPGPTLEALRRLDDLGAVAAARLVRRRLRDLGVRTIPRGPQPATRAHPAGLTARQADVLALMTDGLTNGEIAERLVVSVRTVDHHVSTILSKLGVPSRRHAIRLARVPA